MKYLQAFYILLACFYGAIFAYLVLVSLAHGMVENALECLFWGICGFSFGLLIERLLNHYVVKRKPKPTA